MTQGTLWERVSEGPNSALAPVVTNKQFNGILRAWAGHPLRERDSAVWFTPHAKAGIIVAGKRLKPGEHLK